MTFKEFYIADSDGKSNCVVRSLCKILNKDYAIVYNELCKMAEKLNCASYNDIKVFEKYMADNNILKIDFNEEMKIKDLKLDNFSYIVFCYDKKDFYHMVPIINNTVYDKNLDCLNLYVLVIYQKM